VSNAVRSLSDSMAELAWLENQYRLGVASMSLSEFLDATAHDASGYSLSPTPIARGEALARVGPGWAALVNELCDEVERAATETRSWVALVGLRRVAGRLETALLPRDATHRLEKIRWRIVRRAARTCELCGRRGLHRAQVWGDVPPWPLGYTACGEHLTPGDYESVHALYRLPANVASDMTPVPPQVARAAFVENLRRQLGRGVTREELERVLRRYPGDQ
jgi:hypothetical protein